MESESRGSALGEVQLPLTPANGVDPDATIVVRSPSVGHPAVFPGQVFSASCWLFLAVAFHLSSFSYYWVPLAPRLFSGSAGIETSDCAQVHRRFAFAPGLSSRI